MPLAAASVVKNLSKGWQRIAGDAGRAQARWASSRRLVDCRRERAAGGSLLEREGASQDASCARLIRDESHCHYRRRRPRSLSLPVTEIGQSGRRGGVMKTARRTVDCCLRHCYSEARYREALEAETWA
mmetsp:Transcript_35440/g.63213  ORF Transcript_35440/g.63213 Transcript_35440/m.63213 type:complete len:129 (+) Transcript_35440:244-630(+)